MEEVPTLAAHCYIQLKAADPQIYWLIKACECSLVLLVKCLVTKTEYVKLLPSMSW